MNYDIKTISLIGMGAMGSFFAPRFYAEYGERFRLIAGGSRKKKLETRGVTINGNTYHFPVIDPEEKGNASDLIIIATKGYDLDQAIEDIRNQVHPGTLILSVMNGVDSEEKMIAAFGAERVLYSFMRVSIVMKDGVANYDPALGMVHFGEKRNSRGDYSPRVEAVRKVMETCGIPYEIDADMLHGIWYKFTCNVAENLTCALLGIPFGAYRDNDDANAIRDAAMKEVQAVAAARRIAVTDEDLAKQDRIIKTLPPANKPSTLQDLEAGKRTEIDMFAGAVIRMGRETGVPTPMCRMYYHSIRALEYENER